MTKFILVILVFLSFNSIAQTNIAEGHIEEQAIFPGGLPALIDFLQKNINVPKQAKNNPGKVLTKFIVNEDGSVSDAQIVQGAPGCPDCEKEAVRVIKLMPAWQPAKIDGKPVKCYFNLPISFKR